MVSFLLLLIFFHTFVIQSLQKLDFLKCVHRRLFTKTTGSDFVIKIERSFVEPLFMICPRFL